MGVRRAAEFKPSCCGNCCGLCGSNCHCQWGVTGVLMGIFVMLAAGVFTVFCTFIPIFMWDWYWYLCIFWFLLGALIFACGWMYIFICGCDGWNSKEEGRQQLVKLT